jgi:type II secretory pathway pseudopilin PulG
MKKRRNYFTLLEMLVVFLILSMGLALTGVKLKEAYEEQRFFSEWNQLVGQLRTAQELMLVMDADVEVTLAYDPKNKQVVSTLSIEKPLDDAWVKLVERKFAFSAIRSFQFNQALADPLVLMFKAGKMSQGELVLSSLEKNSSQEKGRRETIHLLGYPAFIEKQGKSTQEIERVAESQMLYPAEVYEKLYSKKNPEEKE